VAQLAWRHRATVQGKVHAVRLAPMRNAPSLEVDVWDDTGGITLIFYGRRSIAGVNAGATLTASGTVGERRGKLTMSNPIYQLDAHADA
jgi:RecG-like helicase